MSEHEGHDIEIKVTTRYDLQCSCGWRVITFDLFETEKLKQFHYDDVTVKDA